MDDIIAYIQKQLQKTADEWKDKTQMDHMEMLHLALDTYQKKYDTAKELMDMKRPVDELLTIARVRCVMEGDLEPMVIMLSAIMGLTKQDDYPEGERRKIWTMLKSLPMDKKSHVLMSAGILQIIDKHGIKYFYEHGRLGGASS